MSNRRFKMERHLFGRNHHQRRTNRNRPPVRAFRQNFGNDSGYLKIDLHTFALHTAKNRIKEELRDAKANQRRGVKFIHGLLNLDLRLILDLKNSSWKMPNAQPALIP